MSSPVRRLQSDRLLEPIAAKSAVLVSDGARAYRAFAGLPRKSRPANRNERSGLGLAELFVNACCTIWR
jgi:hypothetical protein